MKEEVLMNIVATGNPSILFKLALPLVFLLLYLLIFALAYVVTKNKKLAAVVPIPPMLVIAMLLAVPFGSMF